jgi:bifunctional non-homologous end joining protein LigD
VGRGEFDTPLGRVPAQLRDLLSDAAERHWLPPMLATLTDERFSDPEWIFERKLDGIRCLASRDATGTVRLLSRNELDMTRTYPEIADALQAQQTEFTIDGEIVAFVGRRTSFERLQGRSGISDPQAALASGITVFYYVFDLLTLDGSDVRRLPLTWRKRLLRAGIDFHDPLRFTTHRVAAGEQMYRAACARGDEGVIAKRAAAPYAGGRSRDWLKFKCVRDQELVIGGYTGPQGSRVGFGALLVGYYAKDAFVYAGKVGTGFDTRTLTQLHDRMRRIEQEESPFTRGRIRERDVHWVRPELVAQIAFTEWTRDGLLRHPRFQGLRTDKNASEVLRERPS